MARNLFASKRRHYGAIRPLTPLGRSLTFPVWALHRWTEFHFAEVDAGRTSLHATHT